MPGNSSFDQIASTALKKYRKTLSDNVFKRTPFFYKMMEAGRKELESGGEKIVEPLTVAKNTTAAGYTGYSIIDVTPQEEISAAQYVWAQYAASIAISGRQERQNSGETQIIKLLEAKAKIAEDSLRTVMDIDLFGSTLDSESKLNGLSALVDTTSTVGGINRSTADNAFWRSNVSASVGSFATLGLNAMRTAYLNASNEGQDAPNFIVTTQTVFEYYEKSLQSQQRFQDNKVADGGFMTLKFKNADMFFDSNVTSGEMYMLNTDWLKLKVHKDADMETTDFVKPANQDAKVAQILWMGNVVILQPRRQAKLTGITA